MSIENPVLSDLLNPLVDICVGAGDKILEIYNSDDFVNATDVQTKGDDSTLTKADLAAHHHIVNALAELTPDVPVLSEESADIAWETRQSWDRYWLVDPLDGTKEFIKRNGEFTVNIALVEAGVPTRGVVYAPAKNRMFFTQANGQSVEETGDLAKDGVGDLTPISVSNADNSALMVVASKSHRDQATDDYIGKYAVRDMTSAGSSLKFCLVATGEADLYPRLGRTMEWDTAAGHAVLKGAGGEVVRFDDHSPLSYGKADFANPFFIAYAPSVELRSA